jgi:hypothetical protein
LTNAATAAEKRRRYLGSLPRRSLHHLLNVLAFVQLANKNGDKLKKNFSCPTEQEFV